MTYQIVILERANNRYDIHYGPDDSGEARFDDESGLTSEEVFYALAEIDERDTPRVFVFSRGEVVDLEPDDAMDLEDACDFFDPDRSL